LSPSDASPSPSAGFTDAPSATPDENGYVHLDGYPFSVLSNPEADELFQSREECLAPDYAISYPDSWIGSANSDLTPCSWFGPGAPEAGEEGIPEGVWIVAAVVDASVGYTDNMQLFLTDQLTVDGWSGHRAELNPDPSRDPDYLLYQYVLPIGPGRTLVALTDNHMAEDYFLAKAVLDRMMGSARISD
jgi:hypothetical protein